MRYRLINMNKTYKCVGTLADLKPVSAYMYHWVNDDLHDYLFLQRQTRKGNKWVDMSCPNDWYDFQSRVVDTYWLTIDFMRKHNLELMNGN